ncbi:hypothetical protein [Acinetobacter baumannii]|uniref:hypothetical protein n=1 Tax=Acinetobacter baumannii TaxID=470 RepID=UPI001FF3B08A|nr:hypothetical protein [Acinetobacter baumannii]MCJ9137753.1 hypothetical protein [Acinetobacter baumannii]MCJ9280629.1 hypothetical protein [Acinetobacter baumannii]MCJ9452252.1 hypothetical protein [Acinetobacter baumannii]MCJ9556399.1 hypothetical protein [Acinetobacter baumannii]
MTDLNKLRSEFEAWFTTTDVYKRICHQIEMCGSGRHQDIFTVFQRDDWREENYAQVSVMASWLAWQEKAKAQAVPENTEDWYLNEDEGLWLDHDGIDGTLCELGIGEVKPVKHKEYLITQSNTLYAARVWNSDDDHIAWKLFESEESALEAANYCKQMYEASESGAANE